MTATSTALTLLNAERERPLPLTDPRHQAAHDWLLDEAELLDQARYAEWYSRIGEEIDYRAPARSTTTGTAAGGVRADTHLYRDNHYSLGKRIDRFATEHAWSEDPPSRMRHLVSNIRAYPGPNDDHLVARSCVLVRRSRGDHPVEEVSAARRDVLRCVPNGLLLVERVIVVDDALLRTQTLGFFL